MTAPALTRRRAMLGALAAGLAAPALARAAAPALRIGAILPLAGPGLPESGTNLSVPAEAARMGLILARDDLQRMAPAGSSAPELLLANAPEPGAIRRAAERLVEHDRATVLIGGFAAADLPVIAGIAGQAGALFMNIAAPADLATDLAAGSLCSPDAVHLEATAQRYLAALIGHHLSQQRRRWHLIHQEGSDGDRLLALAKAELGARPEAGLVAVSPVTADRASLAPAVAALADSGADIALMLTDWTIQLETLALAEAARPLAPLTGFPWAATQTRAFYNRCRQIAPGAGTTGRVALWEARAETPWAAALDADFMARWRQPMDASAWAALTAFRLAAGAAGATGSLAGRDLRRALADPAQRTALLGDMALRLDPVNGQIAHPLFVVEVDPLAPKSTTPEAMKNWARILARLDDSAVAKDMPANCGGGG